jgi:transcriptional regulator with XRE-family HTH domain
MMRFDSRITDDAVLAEIGARIERTRLERNLTQRHVAHEAGVGERTLKRLEAGGGGNLTTLVRVLRALDLLPGLEALLPEPLPSPIQQARLAGARRRRASEPPAPSPPEDGWTWGDETPDT